MAAGMLMGPGVTSCARELPPPGTRPDELPPVVERIRPAPDSVVQDFDGEIEIRFDEPVNIPNDIARRLFASPMEEYEADIGFSSMRLRPRGGWRDSVVYCLSIPEGISDLLRNRIEGETEFCFSTGPPVEETRVSGSVIDAVTRLPQNEALVIFLAPGDSTPYGARTDNEGRFSARALPSGEYQAFGFIDQNRSLSLDRDLEPHDSASFVAAVAATPELDLAVVPPDTTPPILLRADAVDSITIQLEFDDYLRNPPDQDPAVIVRDSASAAQVEVLAARVGAAAEVDLPAPEPPPGAEDSLGLAVDSTVLTADSLAAPDPFAAFDSLPPVQEEGPPLPSRFVSVRLAMPLDSTTYIAEARGIVNLRRLTGGGETTFRGVVADSLRAAADSAAAVLDSVATALDTAAALPDTVGMPPDTLGTPPDTLGTPPDTLGGGRR